MLTGSLKKVSRCGRINIKNCIRHFTRVICHNFLTSFAGGALTAKAKLRPKLDFDRQGTLQSENSVTSRWLNLGFSPVFNTHFSSIFYCSEVTGVFQCALMAIFSIQLRGVADRKMTLPFNSLTPLL